MARSFRIWGLGPIIVLAGLLYASYDTFKANRDAPRTAKAFWQSDVGLSYETNPDTVQIIPNDRFPTPPQVPAKVASNVACLVALNDDSGELQIYNGGNVQSVTLAGGEMNSGRWDLSGALADRVLLVPHRDDPPTDEQKALVPVWASLTDGSLARADGILAACIDRSGSTFTATSEGFVHGDGSLEKLHWPGKVTSLAADRIARVAAAVVGETAYSINRGKLVELHLPWQFFGFWNHVHGVAVAGHDHEIWVSASHPGRFGTVIVAFDPAGQYLGKVAAAREAIRTFGPVGEACPPVKVLDAIRSGH